jgi:hypothetical protein
LKYCDYIQDRPETLILGWDDEKIKQDFVSFYNNIVLSDIGRTFLDGSSPEDSVVQFLYKNDLIGVTEKGDELYIKNNFLYNDDDTILTVFNVPKEHTFKGYVEKMDSLIRNVNKEQMNEIQYGIFSAMNSFYKKIIIQGENSNRYEIIIEQ